LITILTLEGLEEKVDRLLKDYTKAAHYANKYDNENWSKILLKAEFLK